MDPTEYIDKAVSQRKRAGDDKSSLAFTRAELYKIVREPLLIDRNGETSETEAMSEALNLT